MHSDFENDLLNEFGKNTYDIIETKWTSEEGIKLNADIRREIARLNPKEGETIQATNNDKALKLAKIIDKHNRQGLEKMSALDIPFAKRILENNRKGYDGLQTHDRRKLRPTDRLYKSNDYENDLQTWKNFLQDKLIPSQAKIISNNTKAKLIFDRLIGDKISDRLYDFNKYANDELDTSIDLKRGLYFKDIESSLAYDRQYGKNGGVLLQTFNQLENFAKQINSKKEFGANPYAVLQTLQQLGEKEKGISIFKRKVSDTTKYYNLVMGINNESYNFSNDFIGSIGSSIRSFKNMASYGTTFFNTLILDTQTAKLKAAERNGDFDFLKTLLKTPYTALEGIYTEGKTVTNALFNKNSRKGLNISELQEAKRLGVGVSIMMQEMRKYYHDGNALKTVETLSRKFNSAALLSHGQNIIESVNAGLLAEELSRDLKLKWNEVTPERQTFLGKSGITEIEFNALKTIEPLIDDINKTDLFYPSFVRDLTDENTRPLISTQINDIEKRKNIELKALDNILKESIKENNINKINEITLEKQKQLEKNKIADNNKNNKISILFQEEKDKINRLEDYKKDRYNIFENNKNDRIKSIEEIYNDKIFKLNENTVKINNLKRKFKDKLNENTIKINNLNRKFKDKLNENTIKINNLNRNFKDKLNENTVKINNLKRKFKDKLNEINIKHNNNIIELNTNIQNQNNIIKEKTLSNIELQNDKYNKIESENIYIAEGNIKNIQENYYNKGIEINKDFSSQKKNILGKFNIELTNSYNISRINLENKIRTSTIAELNKIQSLSTLKNRPISQAGTAIGEGARFIAQFKTSPSNYITNILESIWYNPNLTKLGKLGHMIGWKASLLLLGIITVWQRDIILGKEPRAITTQLLSEATLQSGILTLYGETANAVFGSFFGTSRNPQATMAINAINFAAPVLGTAFQIGGDLVELYKKGDPNRLIQDLRQNTPFQNVWLTRALTNLTFDVLSQLLGGTGIEKRKRSISRQDNILGNERDYLPPFKYAYQ